MKKIIKSSLFIDLLLIIILSIPSVREIWRPGYYPMHDDLQVMRLLEMDKCFEDGQIPCRWVPDMGYRYGYPLFNFYPPMPYYLGQVFRSAGLSYISTVKVIFTLGFFVSGVGMYLLTRPLWGRGGALISSLFYVYAPYHSTDVYVRGAMNEFWAIAWYPFVLYGIRKTLLSPNRKSILALSFSSAMLLLSHNPMTMIFAPIALLWTIFILWQDRQLVRNFKYLVLAGLWGAGLAAFFTLPVLFETKYAHVETLVIGYFNYLAHYLDINQLFFRMNWGYGESVHGPNDTMSFHLGYLHWIMWGIVSLLSLINIKKNKYAKLILFISSLTLVYTFFTHSRSTEIWKVLKPLEFLQFPWRLLSVIIFGMSFLAGSIVIFIGRGKAAIVTALLVLSVIAINAQYFRWRDLWPWVDDNHKLSGELWRLQTTSGIFDYLPVWAPLPPPNPPKGDIELLEGKGTLTTDEKISNYQKYTLNIESTEALVRLNTFYFPGWTYWLDGKKVLIDPEKNLDKEVGRPEIFVPQGEHVFEARFGNTPIRSFGNIVSIIAWAVLLWVLFSFKKTASIEVSPTKGK
jgi:uncharacterized membrane protein